MIKKLIIFSISFAGLLKFFCIATEQPNKLWGGGCPLLRGLIMHYSISARSGFRQSRFHFSDIVLATCDEKMERICMRYDIPQCLVFTMSMCVTLRQWVQRSMDECRAKTFLQLNCHNSWGLGCYETFGAIWFSQPQISTQIL